MTQLILLILILVTGSALFSGLEAALFAVPVSRVKVLEKQGRRGSQSLARVKDTIGHSIIVIAIFNNVVNIAGSIFVGVVASNVFGSTFLGIISAVLTILVIIFGEIVPKTIGENNSESISLFFAPLLLISTKVLFPLVWVLESITKPFIKKRQLVSEEDLHVLSELGYKEGSIEEDEKDIIQKAFLLNDLSAKDIMTPRRAMFSFEADTRLGDVRDDIYSLINSRIPVYEGTLDEVIGVCHRDDLLIALAQDQDDKTIRDFLKPTLFVRETAKADELLPLFQGKQQHLAVVEDEFDGTSGVVTLEDVLEQLVGDIVDETDIYVSTREEAQKYSRYKDIE